MSYSITRAALIADQIGRLANQHPHQLAVQIANLGFWISEAVAAIATIDDYPARFKRLRDAQVAWVRAHGTKVSVYCDHCGGACEFGPQAPLPLRRVPVEDLAAAREAVRRAARLYLLRLYRMRLLEEDGVRRASDELGFAVEREDFVKRAPPGEG